MKKNKHITINLNEYEYKQLELLAKRNRRKLAEFIALIVLDATETERAQVLRIGDPIFKKAEFKKN